MKSNKELIQELQTVDIYDSKAVNTALLNATTALQSLEECIIIHKDQPEYTAVLQMVSSRLKVENEVLLENNVYDSHDDAEGAITERLEDYAGNDCEGSYNCGLDEYTQVYKLKDNAQVYIATLEVEYNRHDKTYYYVDGTSYSFKELE